MAEIDAVYIDFQKNFDSMPHNEILLQLWNTDINGSCRNGLDHIK